MMWASLWRFGSNKLTCSSVLPISLWKVCFIDFHCPVPSEFLLIILFRELCLKPRYTAANNMANAALWPCDQKWLTKLAQLDRRLIRSLPRILPPLSLDFSLSLLNTCQVGISCIFFHFVLRHVNATYSSTHFMPMLSLSVPLHTLYYLHFVANF